MTNYNDIQERTYKFGLAVAKMVDGLPRRMSVYAISKQLIRSATSIGANTLEGNYATSKKEFIQYINIARKSAKESEYWLRMLIDLKINSPEIFDLLSECDELIRILSTIILKSRKSN